MRRGAEQSEAPRRNRRPAVGGAAPGRNNDSANVAAGIYYAEEMTTRGTAKADRSAKPKPNTTRGRRRSVQYGLPPEWIGASSNEAPAHVRRIIMQHAEAGTESHENPRERMRSHESGD
jgi:hypothetical protein